MDYEKKYYEALEKARKAYNAIQPENYGARKIIEDAFPELAESEDERIRRTLVEYFGPEAQLDLVRGVPIQKIRDWLEKQKEQKPIKWTDLTWKDIVQLEGIINNVNYEFRNGIGQESFGKEVLEKFREYKGDEYLDEKEQKPNIELIQRSWYMEGYHDRDFGKEPKWILKTGEGGPKHEVNPRYGQPLKQEQKPVEIHIDNPNIQKVDPDIKIETRTDGTGDLDGKALLYTADKSYKIGFRDGVASVKPVEWSEEDEKRMNAVIELLENTSAIHPKYSHRKLIIWLKSLRPSWKPSEEQMDALKECGECKRCIKELYENLKHYRHG